MEMKKGFTLIEMIFVIVISAILSIGSFKAIEALYIRSAKAQAITDMTLRSQIVLDQLSQLIYNRIPNSVIGYKADGSNDCESIDEITSDDNYTILEWVGSMNDELIQKKYDSFIDMSASDKDTNVLATRDIRKELNSSDVNLIFAGSFDDGTEGSVSACEGAFGWHGRDSNLSFIVSIDENSTKLTDDEDHQPDDIYEKYYLTNTAYAVARGKDLNISDLEDNCDGGNYVFPSQFDFNTTLFLFYGYQPYEYDKSSNTEIDNTFCGDSVGTREGNVSILATDIHAFEVEYKNRAIILNLDMNRTIRGATSVYIPKQKAIY